MTIAAPVSLLDATQLEVSRKLKLWRIRGYVTFDELDAALPQDASSENIEATMVMLSAMSIDCVVSTDEGCGD
jgi:RNA polymerase primary sigma factor